MLSRIHIQGFRAFRELTVDRLARVNLFVGTNNAGKTCVLDAVELLAGGGEPYFLYRIARRLEDRVPDAVDVRQLFHGRSLAIGSKFMIEERDQRRVVAEIVPQAGTLDTNTGNWDSSLRLPSESDEQSIAETRCLELTGTILDVPYPMEFSSSGLLRYARNVSRKMTADPILYIGTTPIDAAQSASLWGRVVLTPQEAWVTDTLRVIEPDIERIALVTEDSRSAFFIKMAGQDQRVPLGSMGDGIRRMLGLSLHLAQCAKGSLLIDEIDSGLHYSVMVKMWRMIIEAAKRLDIQIFATTHSLDCIHALADLYDQSPEIASELLLHRIDRGAPTAMTYTAEQLHIAAEQHMEVR